MNNSVGIIGYTVKTEISKEISDCNSLVYEMCPLSMHTYLWLKQVEQTLFLLR